jgi:prepilin-type N-terminal cleavage/methylation domain-containing protein
MNKRGFTLAEMLAVIAVLGILVLIVLPNVLKNYREAKKIALIDEAKTVYTKATDQYVLERTKGNKIGLISSDGTNKLDLQNSDNLEYYIRINNEGQVLQFRLSNGEYCIVGVGDFLPNYTKEDVIDLSDEKQAELCAVTTLVDNATYELALQVHQPKEKEHDPRTIYLKYNAGWYKNKSLKTELDKKNGQYKIDAPYRANNY